MTEKRYADEKNIAFYDAISEAKDEALQLEMSADGNENDTKAIISLIKGELTALMIVESRLGDIEEEIKTANEIHRQATKVLKTIANTIVACAGLFVVAIILFYKH